MPYPSDKEINLPDPVSCNYIISSQHRRKGNPNKCIWTINHDEEVACFTETMISGWKSGTEAWGLRVVNNILQVIGINNDTKELKLAKFVDGSETNVWHGYPADYMRRAQDRPTTIILKAWVDTGFLTKSKMSKIRLGQSCNL